MIVSKKNKKIRADQLLVLQGLAESRSKAQSLILAGVVYRGTQRIDKSSEVFPPDTLFTLHGKDHDYVSRGGVKLKGALDHFQVDVKNKICLDVGASTGGFTDCLLKEGAQKVYAVDVGYGQLAWSLRQDPRVVVIERTNFREFDNKLLKDPIDLVVVDVSFISLKLILPKVFEIFKSVNSVTQKILIFLIKPQFEVGKFFVGKGGVVRDLEKRDECVRDIQNFCENHFVKVKGVIPSPLLGQDGNQEFLLVGEI